MNLKFVFVWLTWFCVTAAILSVSHRTMGTMKPRDWLDYWLCTFMFAALGFQFYSLHDSYKELVKRRQQPNSSNITAPSGWTFTPSRNGVPIGPPIPIEQWEKMQAEQNAVDTGAGSAGGGT